MEKVKKTGWLVLALVIVFMLTVPNIAADTSNYGISHEYGDLPDDVTISSPPVEEGDINDYPELDVFDGFQIRQSLFGVTSNWEPRGPYGRASLVGWKDNFVLYFPIGETHDLALTGYLKLDFVDGTTYVNDNWYHLLSWTNNGQVPWLCLLQVSFSFGMELKRIEYDVNYMEDGQYVRHVHRVFIDLTYYSDITKAVSSMESVDIAITGSSSSQVEVRLV